MSARFQGHGDVRRRPTPLDLSQGAVAVGERILSSLDPDMTNLRYAANLTLAADARQHPMNLDRGRYQQLTIANFTEWNIYGAGAAIPQMTRSLLQWQLTKNGETIDWYTFCQSRGNPADFIPGDSGAQATSSPGVAFHYTYFPVVSGALGDEGLYGEWWGWFISSEPPPPGLEPPGTFEDYDAKNFSVSHFKINSFYTGDISNELSSIASVNNFRIPPGAYVWCLPLSEFSWKNGGPPQNIRVGGPSAGLALAACARGDPSIGYTGFFAFITEHLRLAQTRDADGTTVPALRAALANFEYVEHVSSIEAKIMLSVATRMPLVVPAVDALQRPLHPTVVLHIQNRFVGHITGDIYTEGDLAGGIPIAYKKALIFMGKTFLSCSGLAKAAFWGHFVDHTGRWGYTDEVIQYNQSSGLGTLSDNNYEYQNQYFGEQAIKRRQALDVAKATKAVPLSHRVHQALQNTIFRERKAVDRARARQQTQAARISDNYNATPPRPPGSRGKAPMTRRQAAHAMIVAGQAPATRAGSVQRTGMNPFPKGPKGFSAETKAKAKATSQAKSAARRQQAGVPLNVPFGQLTAAQKAALKATPKQPNAPKAQAVPGSLPHHGAGIRRVSSSSPSQTAQGGGGLIRNGGGQRRVRISDDDGSGAAASGPNMPNAIPFPQTQQQLFPPQQQQVRQQFQFQAPPQIQFQAPQQLQAAPRLTHQQLQPPQTFTRAPAITSASAIQQDPFAAAAAQARQRAGQGVPQIGGGAPIGMITQG